MVRGSRGSLSEFPARLAGPRHRACFAHHSSHSRLTREERIPPAQPPLALWQFAGSKAGGLSDRLRWNISWSFQDEMC